MWPAMGCTDSPADEAKERTPDDRSGSDWCPFVGVADRAESRPNAEADRRPDHSVTSVAMLHPRRLVCSSGISMGRKRRPRSTSGKLSQSLAIVGIRRDVGSPCVVTPRGRDFIGPRGTIGRLPISSLCQRA